MSKIHTGLRSQLNKRILIFLTVVSLGMGILPFGLFSSAYVYASEPEPPFIGAVAAILIDLKSGEVIYEKNADSQLPPASTTKIMTGILALESLPLDKVLTVDGEAVAVQGARTGLIEGEELTVEQVLYGMLLPSGNDSAVVLAKAVSGTIPEFAAKMNEKAVSIGAISTNFVNPNGLSSEGHVSTARDLAAIAKYAMNNEKFREIVKTISYTIPPNNKRGKELVVYTTNNLLYDDKTMLNVNNKAYTCKYESAIGIKTGTTPEAGACLVSAAQRTERSLLAVVLGDTEMGRYADTIALFEYGFESGVSFKVLDMATEEAKVVKVKKGSLPRVSVALKEDVYITLPKEASREIVRVKIDLPKYVQAPVEEGQEVGKIYIYEADTIIREVPLYALYQVGVGGFWSIFGISDKAGKIINIVLISLAVIFVVGGIWILALINRKKRILRERRKKKAMEIALERKRKEEEARRRSWPY